MGTTDKMNKKCLLLNSYYMPVRILSTIGAIKMKYEGTAKVLVEYSEEIRSPSITWKIPAVMVETKVRPFKKRKVRWSAEAMYMRDKYRCCYCNKFLPNRKDRSIDHVIPQCEGGQTDFTNCVTACNDCNKAKGRKSCEEWGRWPNTKLEAPTHVKFSHPIIMSGNAPKEWEEYLDGYVKDL